MSVCKLAFVGDVMLGDSFYTIGRGVSSMLGKYGDNFLAEEIVEIFRSHDIVFCNLESPASDIGMNKNSLRKMHMRASPQVTDMMKKWGINIANLANNHILEHGLDAAVDTANNLKNSGISVIGAGNCNYFEYPAEPLYTKVKDMKIMFIGLCLLDEKYSYGGGMSLDETIEKLRNEQTALNIISLHWGMELMERPTDEQIATADKLMEAGADMVIGHHPHVVQGFEHKNNKLIAHSLGNFIFNGYLKDTQWSTILSVSVKDNRNIEIELFPVVKDKKHRPVLAKGAEKEKLLIEIDRRSKLLQNQVTFSEYNQQYRERILSMKKKLYFNLAENVFFMPPVYWPQVIGRFFRRRAGTW